MRFGSISRHSRKPVRSRSAPVATRGSPGPLSVGFDPLGYDLKRFATKPMPWVSDYCRRECRAVVGWFGRPSFLRNARERSVPAAGLGVPVFQDVSRLTLQCLANRLEG